VASVAGRVRHRLPDTDHMIVLARHLAPVAVAVFLAQGFFLAGYFDPMGALPLGVLTFVALVAITAGDYRADIRQRQLIDDLRRRHVEAVQEARVHRTRLADDITRLATVATDAAAAPTLLSAQLAVLTPVLVDLLGTPSAARRERLLGELEQAGIRACAELAGSEGAQARAVFYRRVGRRFEPSWPEGSWGVSPPLPVPRTSETARELRLLLRRRHVVPTTTSDAIRSLSGVRVPLHAGRRGVGVLSTERQGGGPLSAGQVEAVVVVARLVAAAMAGAHMAGRASRARVSDRSRARWSREERRLAGLVADGRHVRAGVIGRLESVVDTPDSRQAVRVAAD
jgi:hypothetical protein